VTRTAGSGRRRDVGPAVSGPLLAWFDDHGRKDLPWQYDPSPYRVWVSEIMLQQTRVATVIPYYLRFIARCPDVTALAAAPEDEVLRLWSGLGYYARARNLHHCARILHEEYDGVFPDEIAALQALPGIGRSTAGAILALALGKRHPVLDGNVRRVLCRYHAIVEWPGRPAIEKRLWALAEAATPHRRVRDYTQAVMDLGATLCTRSQPDCARCPLAPGCAANAAGLQHACPAPRPKTVRPERRATLLLLTNPAGEILLERRPPAGIWGGLWSLPEAPSGHQDLDAVRAWCADALCCRVEAIEPLEEVRHGFTHFVLAIRPLHGRAIDTGRVMESGRCVWYNGARSRAEDAAAAGPGMPAPVRRLVMQWFDSQGAVDVAHGTLRQAG
jgi:A/G-specific adenine glycosylase